MIRHFSYSAAESEGNIRKIICLLPTHYLRRAVCVLLCSMMLLSAPSCSKLNNSSISDLYGYNEGVSWVSFNMYGKQYCGVVDKSGNVSFYFDKQNIILNRLDDREQSVFDHGLSVVFSYGEYDNKWDNSPKDKFWIFNKSGDILASSKDSDYDGIHSYKDGYFITYSRIADYSHNDVRFQIMDSSLKPIKEFTYEYVDDLAPYDREKNKIYSFHNYYWAWNLGHGFFSFGTGKYIQTGDSVLFPDIHFYYDTYNVDTDSVWRVALREGPLETYRGPGNTYQYAQAYDGSARDTVILDLVNKKIDPDGIHTSVYYEIEQFDGDYYLDKFEGKDGEDYCVVVSWDTGEMQHEPIRCQRLSTYDISCDRFIINSGDTAGIYDLKGNQIVSFEEIGATWARSYNDDVAICDGTNNSHFLIDKNGTILFDTLNLDNARYIELAD